MWNKHTQSTTEDKSKVKYVIKKTLECLCKNVYAIIDMLLSVMLTEHNVKMSLDCFLLFFLPFIGGYILKTVLWFIFILVWKNLLILIIIISGCKFCSRCTWSKWKGNFL